MKALAITCVICFPLMCACTGPANPVPARINVSQLHTSAVIGLLGKRLGSRTTIEGHHVNAKLSNPLKITAIDCKETQKHLVISLQDNVKLEKGVTYKLEGYESGSFGASPSWIDPGAAQYFRFHSFFVVTSVLESNSK